MTYNVFSGTLNPTHFTSALHQVQRKLLPLHLLKSADLVTYGAKNIFYQTLVPEVAVNHALANARHAWADMGSNMSKFRLSK